MQPTIVFMPVFFLNAEDNNAKKFRVVFAGQLAY